MRRVLVTAICLMAAMSAYGEDYIDLVEKGNEAFKQSDYKTALDFYHSAETDLPESPELDYNIGSALSKDEGYEQAVEKLTRALNTTDIGLEASAHYNLGNTHYWMGDYQKAITSYENSLRINPDDMDAKYNLELARRMLKENMDKECEKPQDQQQQQEQEQEQQQQQDQQDQQNKDEEQQQQQDEQQQQEPDEQQQQPDQLDEKEISREDAERILNALRDDEEDVQKKIKRKVKAKPYTGKDW